MHVKTHEYISQRSHALFFCEMNTSRCLVWTGDGRVFYYNPSCKLSVWEKPEDLEGRLDVDRMIQEQPPIGKKEEPNAQQQQGK